MKPLIKTILLTLLDMLKEKDTVSIHAIRISTNNDPFIVMEIAKFNHEHIMKAETLLSAIKNQLTEEEWKKWTQ